jgi:hypothetical protein
MAEPKSDAEVLQQMRDEEASEEKAWHPLPDSPHWDHKRNREALDAALAAITSFPKFTAWYKKLNPEGPDGPMGDPTNREDWEAFLEISSATKELKDRLEATILNICNRYYPESRSNDLVSFEPSMDGKQIVVHMNYWDSDDRYNEGHDYYLPIDLLFMNPTELNAAIIEQDHARAAAKKLREEQDKKIQEERQRRQDIADLARLTAKLGVKVIP